LENLFEMLEGRLMLSSTVKVSTKVASLQSEAGSINADFAGAADWIQGDRVQLNAAIQKKTFSRVQIREARKAIAELQQAVNSSTHKIVAGFKKLAADAGNVNLQSQLETAREALWTGQSSDQKVIADQLGMGVQTTAVTTYNWIAGGNSESNYNDPNSWDKGSVPGVQDVSVFSSVPVQDIPGLDQSLNSCSITSASTATISVQNNSAILTLAVTGTTVQLGAQLDLTSNSLIIHGAGGNLANIVAQLKAGSNSIWNGTAGIASSASASDTRFLTTLGNPPSDVSASSGLNSTISDVLVKYTYYGDENLDGVVEGADYTLIDSGSVNTSTGWTNGDFNYDGVVDGTDYSLIDNTFNSNAATSAPPLVLVTSG
jgi:hypothetical protein